jgi:hypothetical protein
MTQPPQKLFYVKMLLEMLNFITVYVKKQIAVNFKITIFAFFPIVNVSKANTTSQ